MQASLITPSFRGDMEVARLLCASIDRYVDPDIDHYLIVPGRDVEHFRPLCNARRFVLAEQDLLPGNFIKLPVPKKIKLGGYERRLRSLWWTPHGLVRGWVLQQILKLSADAITPRDIFVFADSDTIFVRPFGMDDLVIDGKVRLYSNPGVGRNMSGHREWHAQAARLLGLAPCDYFGADYIGTGITWERDTLQRLKQRLAEQAGGSWQAAICRSNTVSEYILYGIFAEHVLGQAGRHRVTSEEWTYGWSFDHDQAGADAEFAAGLEPQHRLALIQSTEDLSIERRRRMLSPLLN